MPRLSEQDIEVIKSQAGYGEADVVLSATLFDELIANYRTGGEFNSLGLAPHEKVRRA